MFIFGGRLLEERKRLGLNQDEMALAGGVAKRTYCNYEAGDREPGAAFLEAIAKAGADVVYILTGMRALPVAAPVPEVTAEAGPMARKKAKVKAMVDQLETDKGLDAVQAVLEGIAEAREVKGRAAMPRKKAG